MFVYDIVDPAELTGFVRELEFAEFRLAEFLPNQDRESLDYVIDRIDRSRHNAASYRGFDVPADVAKRPGVARMRGSIPPISKKILLGEEDRLRLQMLRGDGRRLIEDQVYDDVQIVAETIAARLELARGEVLTTGKVTFTNDRGFVDTEIDYGVPSANFIDAASTWATAASANPITDLQAGVRAYMAANRQRRPARVLMSDRSWNRIILADSTRALLSVGGTVPSIVTPDAVRALLASLGLPPVTVYDAMVSVDDVDVRTTDEDAVVFLPEASPVRFGETTFGVTAEALELAEARRISVDDAPGLTAVNQKTFDPVHLWTKVAALAVPVLKDPNAIVVMDSAPA